MAGTLRYYNLTGGLNSIQGLGTINQTPTRTESPDMQNVEYYQLSGLKSMEGNIRFSKTVFESRVTLGYEYIYQNQKIMIVTTEDGKCWKYNKVTDTFEEFYQFPLSTHRHSIISFNNGVVLSNGVDDLVYYNPYRNDLLTGTIQVEVNSLDVIGTNTKFTTELHSGDYITIGNLEGVFIVDRIVDDTHLVLEQGPSVEVLPNTQYRITTISLLKANYTNEDDPNINIPIRGLAMMGYQGRIFVGDSVGRLFFSEIGNIHGWDLKYGAGVVDQFYNDNTNFVALIPWDRYLLLCKREKSYLLDGTNADTQDWVIQPYSNYTCDSQQSWIDCNNGLYVYSRQAGGIYPMLQRTVYNSNFQGIEASLKIRDNLKYINTSKYEEIFPVYHPKKKYMMFYTPLLTSTGSNDCFIYDITSKSWLHRKVTQEVSIAFKFNDEVYIGTQDGLILKEFIGTTFDDKPIEFWWKSPWLYFGRGTDELTTKEFRIKIAEEDANNFTIRNRRDGRDIFKKREISNDLGIFTGLIWDAGYLREDLNFIYPKTLSTFQVNDGENNYYTPRLGEVATTLPVGNKLFYDSSCTDYAGISGGLYDLVKSNSLDFDIETSETKSSYEWEFPHRQYYRYTNGEDIIQIDWSQRGPNSLPLDGATALINKGKVTTGGGHLANAYRLGDTTCYLFDNEERQISGGKLLRNSIGNPIKYNNTEIYWYLFEHNGKLVIMGYTDHSSLWGIVGQPSRYEGGDLVETSTTRLTQPDTPIGIISSSRNGDIFELVTTAGTFSNLSGGTYGDEVLEKVYTDTDTIQPSTKWFNEPSLSTYNEIGTTYNNFIVITRMNAMYTPTYKGKSYYVVYDYFKQEPKQFIYTGETGTRINPIQLREPTEEDFNTDSLTDTVWDEDSWVITRHIVKRMLLPRQYFQSMQLEFYGNSVDNAMAIYGFEIDGVELTEVPY